ncbi:Repressor ROX1 [Termitomyces sp. T112]|nr:Repressor ROX1 [Termitomyces sp. T112]
MLCLQTNPQMLFDHLASQGQPYHYQCASNTVQSFIDVAPSANTLISGHNPGTFETSVYNYSEASSPSGSLPPSPPYQTPSPQPSPSPQKPAPRLRSGNRIPRPRNAFMIFRSEFWAGAKISKSVEHDHRHISRIVGHCWNQLTEEEKAVWRRRAEQEKIEHQIKYPGYRFSPNVRTKQVIKRNVKRNGEDEMLRCKQVAELLLAGKAGKELDTAVKSIDLSLGRDPPLVKSKKALEFPSDTNEYPAFRSPLLPPERPKIDTQAHQYSNEIRSSRNYQQQQCQSSWTLQYPNLPEVNNSSYPIQQYTSDPRSVAPSSSHSQCYHSSAYPSESHHESNSVNTSHGFPRSSTFQIDFISSIDYNGRYEPHTTHGHIAPSLVDPVAWITPRQGH